MIAGDDADGLEPHRRRKRQRVMDVVRGDFLVLLMAVSGGIGQGVFSSLDAEVEDEYVRVVGIGLGCWQLVAPADPSLHGPVVDHHCRGKPPPLALITYTLEKVAELLCPLMVSKSMAPIHPATDDDDFEARRSRYWHGGHPISAGFGRGVVPARHADLDAGPPCASAVSRCVP
jgi:hypothetical protein